MSLSETNLCCHLQEAALRRRNESERPPQLSADPDRACVWHQKRNSKGEKKHPTKSEEEEREATAFSNAVYFYVCDKHILQHFFLVNTSLHFSFFFSEGHLQLIDRCRRIYVTVFMTLVS